MAMSRAFVAVLPALFAALALGSCASPRQAFAGNPALPFSKAVLVGDTLYVAGHLGVDPTTGMAPSDPAEEVRLLLSLPKEPRGGRDRAAQKSGDLSEPAGVAGLALGQPRFERLESGPLVQQTRDALVAWRLAGGGDC